MLSISSTTRLVTGAVLLAASLLLTNCAAATPRESGVNASRTADDSPPGSTARDLLAGLMQGVFASDRQAAETAALPDEQRFLPITVRMHRIHVWNHADESVYLYLEQAVSTASERPYRQRVYRLDPAGPGRVTSTVLWLPEAREAEFIGAGDNQDVFQTLSPDDLEDRSCVVALEHTADRAESPWVFVGETVGDGCTSNFRGAVRTTSVIRFARDRFEAWDRGWNAADQQVWGPSAGPYTFDRLE